DQRARSGAVRVVRNRQLGCHWDYALRVVAAKVFHAIIRSIQHARLPVQVRGDDGAVEHGGDLLGRQQAIDRVIIGVVDIHGVVHTAGLSVGGGNGWRRDVG